MGSFLRAVVTLVLFLLVAYSPAVAEQPFERAVAEASEVGSYRFTSRVELRRARSIEVIETNGQVRDRGPGRPPDLFAFVRSNQGQVQVLRLPEGAWSRRLGRPWVRLDPEGAESLTARRLVDVLGGIRARTTTRDRDGSTRITGVIDGDAVGLGGGEVPVTAVIDAAGHLVRLDYTASVAQAGERVRLRSVTRFSEFDVPLEWPLPPRPARRRGAAARPTASPPPTPQTAG